jgi:serine O-acetyltransferase
MKPEVLKVLQNNVLQLSNKTINEYQYIPDHDNPMPSLAKVRDLVELLRSIIFPGYHGNELSVVNTLRLHLHSNLENIYELLSEQIFNGLNYESQDISADNKTLATNIALSFLKKIPELKRVLATDIKATFDGDPAATSYSEVIYCYPSIRAVLNYRMAHELLKLGVPAIPRVISELAHSETGIDIHPGAQIGEYFSIDHGTGVVIGETTIVGKRVRLYQGVTLGAKSFIFDSEGNPINTPRHPILEDNIVVYANANILGRITIGKNSIIGGNVWLTKSIPANSRIIQHKAVDDTSIIESKT